MFVTHPNCKWLLAVFFVTGCLGLVSPRLSAQEEATAATTTTDKPQIDSPLAVPPETPEEIFDAIVLMVDIDRLDVARAYLEQFLEGNPTEELILSLRLKHGPAIFLKLANLKPLHPFSLQLQALNQTVFNKYATDPARMDGLIRDLTQGTADQRDLALFELETSGVVVVPTLIRAIGSQQYAKHQDILQYALLRIGKPAAAPLVAVLESGEIPLQATALDLLGRLGEPAVTPYLIYFAAENTASDQLRRPAREALRSLLRTEDSKVEPTGIIKQLKSQALAHFQQQVPWKTDESGATVVWEWSAAEETVVPLKLTPTAASTRVGLHFARQALTLAPEQSDVQIVYLSLLFAAEAGQVGWFDPLPIGPGSAYDLTLSLGPEVAQQVLKSALSKGQTGPAVMALRVLARTGTSRQLLPSGTGTPSAVIAALNYPDQRVQYAAAATAVAFDPRTTYAGSDRVVQILTRALSLGEESLPRAVVIDSAAQSGQRINGFLGTLGYAATLHTTGREGFRFVSETQATDLILIEANVARWPLSETIANLKADARTGAIPIVIYGPVRIRPNLEIILRQYRGVTFVVEPTAAGDLEKQMADFLKQELPQPLSDVERSSFATQSAELLGYLTQGQRAKLYPLGSVEATILTAASNPALTSRLIPVVGALESRAAQTQLAALTLDGTVAATERIAAADQLALHIERHALQLPKDTVGQLQQLWSQEANPELHGALASVMGALRPDPTLVGQRLRSQSTPNQTPAPMATPSAPND